MALSVMLLVGAGVLVRSFVKLQAVEPYPKASQPTPPQQIVATVAVTKA